MKTPLSDMSGHPRGERRGNCPLSFGFVGRFRTQREPHLVVHNHAPPEFK